MRDYEKLGAFYLGRRFDLASGRALESEPILYDSKDLTTHAVIVGMTGSGKTGLAVTLLEEAAIDGIPVIAIDPKGDLGNLLLTFPALDAASFRPWIDEAEAARRGRGADEEAEAVAQRWRHGLAEWDQPPERIARFAAAADRAIYTPGSRAGRPLGVLRSLAPPAAAIAGDEEALRERVQGAVGGLLGLLGIDADPLRSREHILLATLFEQAWKAGRPLDLAGLIRRIQKPGLERVGVLDLESFFPAKERAAFALAVNNLAASPAFAAWSEGEPLDAARLLYTEDGRPRLSIVSIAHLSDAERMFVVTLLLSEIVSWMRAQPGTPSLRALLYMDEVFGFFPPVANPPAKAPMLTLLKQARAYGLGVVLATQNPVDLDYKGLGNTGTWLLGRLSTERDKARVIEGLEAVGAGPGLDRASLDATLSALPSRVFLMRNVHEDAPVLIQSRWALSYLAGPLTRDQIRRLEAARPAAAPSEAQPAPVASAAAPAHAQRPPVPAGVAERFLPVATPPREGEALEYRPAALGVASLHYANAKLDADHWEQSAWLAPLGDAAAPWEAGAEIGHAPPDLDEEPAQHARWAELPPAAARAESWERWRKALAAHLYRHRALVLYASRDPKCVSRPGESEGALRARLRDLARAARDGQLEKLRAKHAPKLAALRDQIARAEHRVEAEREQYSAKKMETAISIGASVVGALFGRKLGSRSNVGRAATAARGIGRAADERGDVARAAERATQLRERLSQLEAEFEADAAQLEAGSASAADARLEEVRIAPRKADLAVEPLVLVWTPWCVGADGAARPAWTQSAG
ncbi:MAG: ATP-binding protein [Proteobacteria bacterium]|nr:MAG: ATP-binding protein [Pseudomonadota bacterium]